MLESYNQDYPRINKDIRDLVKEELLDVFDYR